MISMTGCALIGSESLILGNLISSGYFSGPEGIPVVSRDNMNAEISAMEFSLMSDQPFHG